MVKKDQDFELWTGNDKRPKITVVDEEGNLADLSNATIYWKATRQSDGSTVMTKSTVYGNIDIVSAEDGEFIVKINADDTEGIDGGTLEHEAKVITEYGLTNHVTSGTIDLIKAEV